jgi:hypothetical protein
MLGFSGPLSAICSAGVHFVCGFVRPESEPPTRDAGSALTGCSGLEQAHWAMGCFACGAAVELAAGERVGFRDTCSACDADLHVCLNCVHYDSGAYNQCREPNAEWVSDRERANRCDYFALGDSGDGPAHAEPQDARAVLDALFKKS